MLDTLKQIGIPTAIATSISLLIVAVPLLFKVDERYAKQITLENEVARLERQATQLAQQNAVLTAELAQNAGFQQAMIGFIAQGRVPTAPIRLVSPSPEPTITTGAGEQPSPSPIPPAPVPSPVERSASSVSAAIAKIAIERPSNWRELNEAVGRQQQRLIDR